MRQQTRDQDGTPTSKSNVSNSVRPYPQMLQFIEVGVGGAVSSPRTVRSHAIKGYHLKRKEAKKAYLKSKTVQLRPIEIAPRCVTEKDRERLSVTQGSEETGLQNRPKESLVEGFEPEKEIEEIPRPSNQLSFSAKLQCRANLVPYAWFDRDGPVLYVNRTKWPFPAPFNLTGSDRTDHSTKSLTPRQSAWMPQTRSPDFTTVKGAVLDPAVIAWIGKTPELFQFRAETIKWIQRRLEDPAEAVRYTTIGAIMTFVMWTADCGNTAEMSTHMDAIERIVNLKGGFLHFQHDGPMVAKLTLFDSITAVLTNTATRFPPVSYIITYPLAPPTIHTLSKHISPLIGSGDFSSMITYHRDINTIVLLLEQMWSLTMESQLQDLYSDEPESTEPRLEIPFTAEPQHPYNTHLLTLPLPSSCRDTAHNHVLDTIHSAAAMYSRALSSHGTDFASPVNTKSFLDLCDSFGKCSDEDFWIRYRGVLLWVLLVGTAAARGKKEAAFWMFYLSRTGSFGDVEGWVVGDAAIRTFLGLQRRMRKTDKAS